MRVLLDAVHAADVWALGALEDRLLANGEETLWLSRENKEQVVELIDARGRDHVVASTAATTLPGFVAELLRRNVRAWRAVRSFRPDVIVTRSPAGVHAGRLTRTPVLYDTDDGHVAGALFRVAGPLADMITTPAAILRTYNARHRRYRGYKELFTLHPARFRPDSAIRAELGLAAGESYSVLRLTAFSASHDRRESGLTDTQADDLIERLAQAGRVLVSSESPLPERWRAHAISARPERFHHVLAAADVVIGDSQSVCAEAAVLGTPSIRINSWVGRHPYQVELEERWGLTRAFGLDEMPTLLAHLSSVLADPAAEKERQRERRAAMLDWAGDPLDDLVEWTYELGGQRTR